MNFKKCITISNVYKLLSIIICSVCLLYQCNQLLLQYSSGKTVVNIEIKRQSYESLPAITLCYPQIVSIKLIKNYCQNLIKFKL